jgi:magnesium-transporting ATPase (P-type)
MSDTIFVLVFICAIAFHAVAWWRFRKIRSSLTSGQKQKAIVGLLANLIALVLPFVYAFSSILTVSLQLDIRWDYVLIGCWVLCALSLLLSLLGPKQVRLPLLLGSLAVAAFWTMVPVGVL